MFNPNTNEMMMNCVKEDCEFLGMVVADVTKKTFYCQFTIGTSSITFATLIFTDGICKVMANGKTSKVNYKGSQEQMSHDVIAKVVKLGLTRLHNMNAKS